VIRLDEATRAEQDLTGGAAMMAMMECIG